MLPMGRPPTPKSIQAPLLEHNHHIHPDMNRAACALLPPSLPPAAAAPAAAGAPLAAGDSVRLSMPSCMDCCGLGLMGVLMGLGCGVALLVR